MNRIKSLLGVFAFALLVLTLPTIASAQWGGNGRNGGYGNGGYGNGGYNNYQLKDTIKRLKRDSKDFVNFLDNALDRSRRNGTDYEDRLNQLAKDFRRAADRLESRFSDRDIYRSQSEAQDVLNLASQLDREMRRARLDYNVQNYWNNMQSQIDEIAYAYGNGRYNNRNDNRNDRNNRNNRNNRNGGWGDWRNKFPF